MQITLTKDNQLCLSTKDHQIIVPPTVVGLRFIIETLKGQDKGERKLAQRGAPTQWEIDKAVKEWSAKIEKTPEMLINTEDLDL
jgi:hypothetical protein